jgi:hypothetical protein
MLHDFWAAFDLGSASLSYKHLFLGMSIMLLVNIGTQELSDKALIGCQVDNLDS